jgi:5'-deoxynucleotidase YfbR-like HD superfamily hydrolase
MEHVGELPVVAVALYPYLDDPEVDLGTALTMLAIHDIGEVVVGDVNTYIKLPEQVTREATAALSILHPYYRELYQEV